MEWCRVALCGVEWHGVEWSRVEWCGVAEWSGVEKSVEVGGIVGGGVD